MHQQDRAMRRRRNQQDQKSLLIHVLLLIAAAIALGWLLLSIQPLPLASCTVTTDNGTLGTYNQCEGK